MMGASSYGMWQTWFVSLFGLTAGIFALGMGLVGGGSRPDEAVGARPSERAAAARA